MIPTVGAVVIALNSLGYTEVGGSDVFRIMEHTLTHQQIKVYYNDYKNPGFIVIRESVEEHAPESLAEKDKITVDKSENL